MQSALLLTLSVSLQAAGPAQEISAQFAVRRQAQAEASPSTDTLITDDTLMDTTTRGGLRDILAVPAFRRLWLAQVVAHPLRQCRPLGRTHVFAIDLRHLLKGRVPVT